MLEDAQKRSKRAGNPITEETLLLIATNTMLSTERFPQADEIWEDLTKNENIDLPVRSCTRQIIGRPRSRRNPLEAKTNLATLTAHLGRRLR